MRYPDQRMSVEASLPPSSVQSWLGQELELRGIDSLIYTRYIISLLQQDSLDVGVEADKSLLWPRKGSLRNKVRSLPKTDRKKSPVSSSEERKKLEAVECLLSISDEDNGIESLIEELCIKLKKLNTQELCSTPLTVEVISCSPDIGLADDVHRGDPAEKYYAAFPALNSQPSSSQVSPSQSDDNNVWKRKPGPEKNPEDSPDPIQEKRKKGNGRKFRKHKGGSGTSTGSQSSDGRRYSRDKAFSYPAGKHEQSRKGKCRLMSWPQGGLSNESGQRLNIPETDEKKSKSHESSDKIQEVCTMLENHLKELLLLNDGKQTQASINEQFYLDYEQIRQIWEPAFGDLIQHDDVNRPLSPEYKENHLWYTEPMGEIFESDDQPGRRLYKRHSFPPGNMFILASVNSRSFMPLLMEKMDSNSENFETREDEALLLPLCIDECSCKEDSHHETPLSPFFLDGNQNIDLVTDSKYDWLCSREPDEEKIAIDSNLHIVLNQDDDLPDDLYQESSPPTLPNFTIGSVNDTPLTGFSEDTETVDNLQDTRIAELWSPVTEQEKPAVSLLDWSYLSQFLDDTELLSHYFPHLDSVYRRSHESPSYLFLDYSPFAYGCCDYQSGLYNSWAMHDRNPCVRTPVIVSDLEVMWPENAFIDSNQEKPCWQNQLLMEEFSNLEQSLNDSMFRSHVGDNQLSQLWDVNMHRRQSASTGRLLGSSNSYLCPERPESFTKLQMHFESVVSGMPVFMFDNLCTLWADTDENTLIPQITLDVTDDDPPADDVFLDDLETLSDSSESFEQLESPGYIMDRSVSLGDMKQPQWDILGLSRPLSSRKPELSRSFELVPSETSAFQDVVPRNLHHVQSEPNMKVADLLAEFTSSAVGAEQGNQPERNDEELLYFSSKTHFRPIQTPVGTPEGSECQKKDLFGDHAMYQPYPVPQLEEDAFVPRFRIQKDMDKYIQTGSSIDEGDGCNLSPIPEAKDKLLPQYSSCDFDIECSNAVEELPDIILDVVEAISEAAEQDVKQIAEGGFEIEHNIAREAEPGEESILSSFSQWEVHQLWDTENATAEQSNWSLQGSAKSIWSTEENVGVSARTNVYSLHTGSFAEEFGSGITIPSPLDHEEHGLIDGLMFCDTTECPDAAERSPDDTPTDNLNYDELFFMDLGEDEAVLESANANTQSTILQGPLKPLPDVAVYSSVLEKEWMNTDWDNHNSVKSERWPKKPCSFFLEGICRRADCKFSHDVGNITCHFWAEGDCFKGGTCPFLHGFPCAVGNLEAESSLKEQLDWTDEAFPSLQGTAIDSTDDSKLPEISYDVNYMKSTAMPRNYHRVKKKINK